MGILTAAAPTVTMTPASGPSSVSILVTMLVLLALSALISWGFVALFNRIGKRFPWYARATLAAPIPLFILIGILISGQVFFSGRGLADAAASLWPVPGRAQIFFAVCVIGGAIAAMFSSWRYDRKLRRNARVPTEAFE
ncbi:hypothetical protein N9D37_01515 [Erythrobacter sp.]|nr:hypothetical protein [Erythrobacter sp.]